MTLLDGRHFGIVATEVPDQVVTVDGIILRGVVGRGFVLLRFVAAAAAATAAAPFGRCG